MILEHCVKAGNVVELRKILRTSSLETLDETDKNGRTPLMLACFRGNPTIIKLLIKHGAGTHSRDNWGKTALMYAVQRGHVDTVKMLLDIHADPAARDNEGRIVEGFAQPHNSNYDTIVQLLRDSQKEFHESRSKAASPVGSPNSRKPKTPELVFEELPRPKTVHDVVRRGILPDIKPPPPVDQTLVKHGAPFCPKDPLELARRGLDRALKSILPQAGGVSKFGLDQQNEKGRTPLMVAILNGKLESCLIIIKAGGDINGVDFTGKSVLFYAIAKRSIEAINALLEAGADPALVDNEGRTPLMQACMDGNVEAVRALLKTGVSLLMIDNKGRTALMYAVAKGNIPTIEELVNAGADPTAKDHRGRRVDQFALTRSNFDKITPVLTDATAKWTEKHPSIHDILSRESSFSYESPPQSPDIINGQVSREDSIFGSPSRLHRSSSTVFRKRPKAVIATPFNPKANRSALDLVRVADYVGLDSFLDGCSLVAINEKDKKAGRTALMVAVLQQKLVPLKMLIEAGADLEIKDNQGKTALAHAAATGNLQSLQILLDAGANLHPLDANGRTPLDQAALGTNQEVFDLLNDASSPGKKKSLDVTEKMKDSEDLDAGKDVPESTCDSVKVGSLEESNEILTIDCD